MKMSAIGAVAGALVLLGVGVAPAHAGPYDYSKTNIYFVSCPTIETGIEDVPTYIRVTATGPVTAVYINGQMIGTTNGVYDTMYQTASYNQIVVYGVGPVGLTTSCWYPQVIG